MSEAKAEVSPEIMAKIRAAEDFHKAKFCPLTQRPCGDVDCQLWVGLEGAAATPCLLWDALFALVALNDTLGKIRFEGFSVEERK